jgi:hypothetical protein
VNRKTIVMLALTVPAVVSTVLADARHHRPARAVACGAGQPAVGHDVGDRDVDAAAHGGRGRGPHRIVPAIALDSATNAATRMVGPLLGGIVLRMARHEGRLYLHRPVQFAGAFALAAWSIRS